VQSAARNAAAAVAPALVAVLPAALLGTQLHATAPCGIVDAHVAVLAAGTPTRPCIINIKLPTTCQALLSNIS